MKTVIINNDPKEDSSLLAKAEVPAFVEDIPELKLTECKTKKDILRSSFNLEKGIHRNSVIKEIGKPNYEASDFRREQTVIYGEHNKQAKAWCYLVVISYDKLWKVDRVSIFSKEEALNKVEHVFE